MRDYLYDLSKQTGNFEDYELFHQYKSEYQSLNRKKTKEFFAKKEMKDFKNNKKYYEFYSASIKIRSDKTSNPNQITIEQDNDLISDPEKVGGIFNSFFTTISSCSLAGDDDCNRFITNTFSKLKKEKLINTATFSFVPTTEIIVEKMLNNMQSTSGAGITGIPTKVFKFASQKLIPILTKLFNLCITSNELPSEWKSAVVTPLYKNKGASTDLNSYRGISVLPPIAKLFEKILATQIIIYTNLHKILFKGQHGFRNAHSCETALHELLSDINEIRDKRKIALLLFIDFRKAFDLVDANKLLLKLFHLGFDNNAIELIANYFNDRSQVVKLNNKLSSTLPIKLGVPQGSILGPLFFLLFINDLPFLIDLTCKLFADDTTLYCYDQDPDMLISNFKKKIEVFVEWCLFNKLDINWSKTYFMFITNKRIKQNLPKVIDIDGNQVKVVDTFKLLGITIDNKLNFNKYSCDLRLIINRKLYSIKRLFYLCTSVKVQFFKTFIMPYFDYCLSLLIYFPKATIQRLNDCFNLCLFKLFGLKFNKNVNDLNNFNNQLECYGMVSFKHRFIEKVLTFIHKIENEEGAPPDLKKKLKKNSTVNKGEYNLRNKNLFQQPEINNNHFGRETFSYFFSKLVNNFCFQNFNNNNKNNFCDLNLKFLIFKNVVRNNNNLFLSKFLNLFPKFN